jgi:hypothetical protein
VTPEGTKYQEETAPALAGAPSLEVEDYCVGCNAKLHESLLVNGFCGDCAGGSVDDDIPLEASA